MEFQEDEQDLVASPAPNHMHFVVNPKVILMYRIKICCLQAHLPQSVYYKYLAKDNIISIANRLNVYSVYDMPPSWQYVHTV